MNSFEANKIFGALLGTVFVLFGGSLLAEGIFHAEAPEKPGFAIEVPDAPAGGGAAPAANEVTPVGQLMQTANAEAGAAIFKRCQACHSGEKGGPNKVGPDLWDVVNRPIASHEGFSYSAAMTEFSEGKTVVWDWDHLNHFLHGPKQYIKGTAMGFAGIAKDQERADLLAYLGTLSDNPPAPPAPDAGAPAGGEAAAEGAAPAEGAA
ncbi:cytochrome c family protein, partial [Aureimonas sp. AU22]|uniref:c-type cytochrome n=1 Tax=Aureimonas sp. AU22 TaxID=1638162 RepID=UPI00078461FE